MFLGGVNLAETVYAYNKMLKCGYTTGSCASAGAKASAYMLLSQNKISEIEYITPSGKSGFPTETTGNNRELCPLCY